jgi:hypothetical protein
VTGAREQRLLKLEIEILPFLPKVVPPLPKRDASASCRLTLVCSLVRQRYDSAALAVHTGERDWALAFVRLRSVHANIRSQGAASLCTVVTRNWLVDPWARGKRLCTLTVACVVILRGGRKDSRRFGNSFMQTLACSAQSLARLGSTSRCAARSRCAAASAEGWRMKPRWKRYREADEMPGD